MLNHDRKDSGMSGPVGLSEAQLFHNERRIGTLYPAVAAIAREHLRCCAGEGVHLLVVQAYRSPSEQAKLYAKGRTGPGRIVTNAPPGMSWHNHRRAYDVAVVRDGWIDWEADGLYERAASIGKSLGLLWGGDFRGLRDLGHFEYHPGLVLDDMNIGG